VGVATGGIKGGAFGVAFAYNVAALMRMWAVNRILGWRWRTWFALLAEVGAPWLGAIVVAVGVQRAHVGDLLSILLGGAGFGAMLIYQQVMRQDGLVRRLFATPLAAR
jgi:hypothetical protein